MKRTNANSNEDTENKKYKTENELFSNNLTNSLVMNAIIKQDLPNVTKLIESSNNKDKSFDINFCNKKGNSLLHIAIEIYTKTKTTMAATIIDKLIDSGANQNLKNSNNETAEELLAMVFLNQEEDDFTESLSEEKEPLIVEPVLEENEHKIQIDVKLTGKEKNEGDSSLCELFDD